MPSKNKKKSLRQQMDETIHGHEESKVSARDYVAEAQQSVKALEHELLNTPTDWKALFESQEDYIRWTAKHEKEKKDKDEEVRVRMIELVSMALSQLTGTCPVRGRFNTLPCLDLGVSTILRAYDVWCESRNGIIGKTFAHNYNKETGEIEVFEMQRVLPAEPKTFTVEMQGVVIPPTNGETK